MTPEKRNQDSDWGHWALIVFLFAIGIWPVALYLLFSKLFGKGGDKKKTAPQASARPGMEQAHPQGHAVGRRAEAAARNLTRRPAVKRSNAQTMKMVGLIAMGIGILLASEPAGMVFDGFSGYLWELFQYSAIAAGGLGLFFGGLNMDATMRRYARYSAVLGEAETVSVEDLSRKLGWPRRRVEKDLAKMIDRGYFGPQAYLDQSQGCFFRSAQAEESHRRHKEAEDPVRQPPKEAEEGYSGILRSIRRANERIADPVLSEKIDRLEDVTARIFRAVEADPKKKDHIDTFMNYYLPTTQKLLDSYAEFDAAGVEGENLRQAKLRIEQTMDSIVAGFEHQLDELYKTDVLDVDSDIRVMETMLRRDTASVERDFGLGGLEKGTSPSGRSRDVDLGGTAAQTQEE
ncbi:5-bromo-4-chloroindolyl phosphate hydrolysis family protein [Oscillibacter sp.]|uniref:5-bromo-4-chloroindolyl phosphate hydrolysis family protein n=1 Tax=Oscillibacter sp. TaxID=1945593 RepID=UPI0028B20AEF|nr:5-bromo-4-chloroindolyl phosphate hydrolysis family protein [Oscillibacter sp.]